MPATTSDKIEIANPNTGRIIKIERKVYDLFSKAIHHTLQGKKKLTYTEIVNGVIDTFKKQKTKFEGSVGWYTVSVKHDMHAKGMIEVFTEKGKKLHRLKKG
jgi:hypothetical protein